MRQADLLGRDDESLHAALFHQLLPVRCALGVDELRLRADRRLENADLLGDLATRQHHHLVLGDHGHGRAGDRIEADDVLLGPRTSDLDVVADELAEVLVVELDQRLFGNAQQQDRLRVLEHLHAGEVAARIHADQGHHRLARIGRDIGDVGRQHHVAEELLLPVDRLVGLDVAGLPLSLREAVGTGDHVRTRRVVAHARRRSQLRRQFRFIGIGLREAGQEAACEREGEISKCCEGRHWGAPRDVFKHAQMLMFVSAPRLVSSQELPSIKKKWGPEAPEITLSWRLSGREFHCHRHRPATARVAGRGDVLSTPDQASTIMRERISR